MFKLSRLNQLPTGFREGKPQDSNGEDVQGGSEAAAIL